MEDEDLQNKNLIELIDWCRKRCTILQTEEMAEMTRKQLTSQFGKRTMHAVQDRRVEQPEEPADKPVPDNDDDLQEALRVAPAWAQKLFAVRQAPPQSVPIQLSARQEIAMDSSNEAGARRGEEAEIAMDGVQEQAVGTVS